MSPGSICLPCPRPTSAACWLAGFSLEKGRLDVSVHPFTGGAHPTDVRMTTRFKVDDITEGLTGLQVQTSLPPLPIFLLLSPLLQVDASSALLHAGAIHETGHALYEQVMPARRFLLVCHLRWQLLMDMGSLSCSPMPCQHGSCGMGGVIWMVLPRTSAPITP